MLLLSFPSEIIDIGIIPEMNFVMHSGEKKPKHLTSFKAVVTLLLATTKFSTLYLISFLIFMVLCHKLTLCQANRLTYQITIFYLYAGWFAVTCWMTPALTTCFLESLPALLKNFLIVPSNIGVCTIVHLYVSNIKYTYLYIHTRL